ncbi:MAG: hypothetical protein Q7S11_02755 [bacterium]|nr:hypothetical protein [bacterium]
MKNLVILGVLMFGVTFQVYAQGVMMGGVVNTEVDSEVNAGEADVKINADAHMEANMRAGESKSQQGTTTKVDKTSPQMIKINASGMHDDEDGDGGVAVMQNNQSDLEFLRKNAISVHAVEVRGWDPKQKQEFLASMKTYAEVRSGQELENFAKGVLLKDDNMASIDVEEEGTSVAYNMPAKFFGMFNSSLQARIHADAEGQIRAKYPWYGFLFKKMASTSKIEADVKTALPEVEDEVLVGFEHRAQVLLTVSNVLKVSHESSMNSIRNMK